MGEKDTELEVELIKRDDWRVVERSPKEGCSAMVVIPDYLGVDDFLYCYNPVPGTFVDDLVRLDLSEYYVLQINEWVSADRCIPEMFEADEADQASAIERLKENLEVSESSGTKLPHGNTSPLRIEAVIVDKSIQLSVQKRIVITELLPPATHFANHHLRGRLCYVENGNLSAHEGSFWENTTTLISYEVFRKGATLPYLTKNGLVGNHVWEAMLQVWQDSLLGFDKKAIKDWEPKNWKFKKVSSSTTGSSYQAPTTNPPQYGGYTKPAPKPAHFRAAGDVPGIEIYRKQVAAQSGVSLEEEVEVRATFDTSTVFECTTCESAGSDACGICPILEEYGGMPVN